ncbi:MAG: glutamine--fructose-6-phosphate transaminase (isomerizing) [Gemmataceae bacterium]
MCGIVGFTGRSEASPILLEGLRRLEYRGYDSAGLVTGTGDRLHLRKKAGRIAELNKAVLQHPAPGTYGISHTRWATHGGATDTNAHPHFSTDGTIAVVHNGVIENYMALKHQLQAEGIAFRSDTDTEVLAHLIRHYYQGDLLSAVRHALGHVKGTYGIAVLCRTEPGVIVGARLGSPLVIGLGTNGHYIASDASALAGYADKVVYLNDRQICQLDEESWVIRNQDLDTVDSPLQDIAHFLGDGNEAELGRFPHFMLKEIYEQPETLTAAMRGRLDDADATAHFGGLNLTSQELRQIDRVIMTACGTSYHAGLVGEYMFEEFARLPVEVEYASEMRYRNPPMNRDTVVLAITQSGETADTLAAMRESKRMGHRTLAICNVVGSSIAREADGGVYLHAGQEVGVASTKAFTSQVCVLAMLALYFGRTRHLSTGAGQRIIAELRKLPDQVSQALECHDKVRKIAERFAGANNALYLGRQFLYPAALEGALKLKEISYIHAEGYAAAEMKHGPIALVDEATPSVFLVPRGNVFDKVMSNMQEIKARGGPVIAVCSPGDKDVASIADEVIPVPDVPEFLQPIVTAIPLQLLAYEIALLRGCDVDKPRNLAKSVTVE